MTRSVIRRSTRAGAAFATATLAVALAGCGGSSPTSTTVPTPSPDSAVGAKFAPVLLAQDASVYANAGVAYANGPSVTREKASITKMRDALSRGSLAVRKLDAPAKAQAPVSAFLTASTTLVAALDGVSKGSDHAISTAISTRVTPALTKLYASERGLRVSLGLPHTDPWFTAKGNPSLIYADNLARPHSKIRWPLASNVTYSHGALAITAPNGGTAGSAPFTQYSYDGQHVTAQVDAKVTAGDPYYGVGCPPSAANQTSHVVGQIGPGGKWSVGEVNASSATFLLSAQTASPAIKAGQVNHIRLDCDQLAPGVATARLYVNGTFLGATSDAIDLAGDHEPGLAVISPSGRSTVEFKNWSVSKVAGS